MRLTDQSAESPSRPLFTIGVVAEMIGVTPATLRLWEKKGLITPARRGKNRSYSYLDLERLQEIRYLRGKRKLNIAGVRAALDRKRCWDIKKCGPRKKDCPVYIREQAQGKKNKDGKNYRPD